MTNALYGLLAEFSTPEELVAGVEAARADGYVHLDAFSPLPIPGLAAAIGRKRSILPLAFLLGGLAGGIGGYFMEYYSMAIDYPLNVGGRPFHSWPSFIPVTFELTVLISALTGFVSLLFAMRLPKLHHPVFNAPEFERASRDRFVLCIESIDPQFSLEATRGFLQQLHPLQVVEVPR